MPNVSASGDGADETTETTQPGCAVAARLLRAAPAGTATRMTSWLLIEQPGPWPADALQRTLAGIFPPGRLDSPTSKGLRPLLIRRPGRTSRNASRAVFVGAGRPGNRWLERLDHADLPILDLDAVADGRPGHGEPVSGPLFLVCTHGAKDMCCAVLGRPVATALAETHPDRTWEVSHLGGDRWAGNLLVVPDGFMHGQLEPTAAALVAKAAVHGQVEPDQLRGRTSASTPWTQYAEIAIRQHTGLRGLDDVLAIHERPLSPVEDEGRVVTVRGGGRWYEITVRRTRPVNAVPNRCSGRIALAGFQAETIRPLAAEFAHT